MLKDTMVAPTALEPMTLGSRVEHINHKVIAFSLLKAKAGPLSKH